ncbi:MAG: UDP-N-acetylmuramoyl-L-alanyl-D-glutamate--2,6-diaminopimelate ligase [Pseudomonadota bacterium]
MAQHYGPKALTELLPGQDLPDRLIRGIALNSQDVGEDFLFAALQGAKVDGATFIPQALEQGAAAILLDQGRSIDLPSDVAQVSAPQARRALAHIAANWFARQPRHCVAVTGTNGKSSTVDLYAQLGRALGLTAASIGTLGVQTQAAHAGFGLTTPDTVKFQEILAGLDEQGITHVALEASSHGLDQFRIDGAQLEAAAFANITRDHLDYHGSFENYLYAKLRLVGEVLPPRGRAVINADADHADRFIDIAWARGLPLCLVGFKGEHAKLLLRQPTGAGQRIVIEAEGRSFTIDFPLMGGFQVDNALLAAGLLQASGPSWGDILPHFGALKPVAGRLERVSDAQAKTSVIVDYAHTPDGLRAALGALRSHTSGALSVVFGCGGDRDAGKRPQMGKIAAQMADSAIVTDDNPRSEDPAQIRSEILVACPGAQDIGDRALAIENAIATAQPGDTVLIAGKGHERGQEVAGKVTPFDDRDVARAILEDRGELRRGLA